MPSILLRLAAIGGTYPLGAPLFGLLLLLRGWLWFPFSLPAGSPLHLRRPAFGLGACHATTRMVPRVFPSPTLLWFISPGFLTTTGSSDSLQRLGRYSIYSRLARFYGCAARSPSITSEDFPSVPAILTLSGLALAFGLASFRRRTLPDPATLVASRSGQRFGFRPFAPHLTVTHCLSPTASRQPGAVWTLTMQPSRLRGVQKGGLKPPSGALGSRPPLVDHVRPPPFR